MVITFVLTFSNSFLLIIVNLALDDLINNLLVWVYFPLYI